MRCFWLMGFALLLCTACDFDVDVSAVNISGDEKTITIRAEDSDATYAINFDGLQFAQSDVTIYIEPVEDSENTRIEVTYSEFLDDYDFYATIDDETISVGADSKYSYKIDSFSMTIYAVFDEIVMNGGGYTTYINAVGIENLDIDASGSMKTEISSLATSLLAIKTSGACKFTLLGRTYNVNLKTTGASAIYAEEFICGSTLGLPSGTPSDAPSGTINGTANIEMTGSSSANMKFEVSLLEVTMGGASDFTSSGAITTADINASGASDFTFSGSSINTAIKASANSNIDAKFLTCIAADIKASNSTYVSISVETTLKVKASGSSYIEYYGSPEVTKDTSGSSLLKQRAEAILEQESI